MPKAGTADNGPPLPVDDVMKIFISYRRSDTRHLAGRLSDILRAADNVETVFIDVDSIQAGADFEVEMLAALKSSDVCLALIGENWAAGDRIHDARDAVRLEVRAALQEAEQGSLQFAPVLVDGATMPLADQLPADLQALSTRNARPLSHTTFRTDLDALAQQLGIEIAPETATGGIVARTAIGGGVALLGFFVASLVHKVALGHSLETTLGSRAALVALFVAVVLAGLIVPNVWPRQSKR